MADRHARRVEFRGVRHHFTVGGAAVPALDDVDLTIEPGEFVTLAGPSGCGKTTLLRLLAGFMPPSEGTVSVGGSTIRGPGEDRGVVFQQPTLFPWLSVRGNVELGPRLRGVPARERRAVADEFLRLVGLADFADHRPYELSGGMQQRCQIARVLANEPDIVLMDEPFGALDALTRERLQEELLEIWRATGTDHPLHHAQRRRGGLPGLAGPRDEPPAGPDRARRAGRPAGAGRAPGRGVRRSVRAGAHGHPGAGDHLTDRPTAGP